MKPNSLQRLLVLVGAFLGAAVMVAAVAAQESPPITVSSTSYTYTFGQQATFSIEASAPASITAVYLYLQPQGQGNVEVHPLEIPPAPALQASLERDLRQFPLPPFGQITWWWEIRDSAGNSLTTQPSSFQYSDNRFDWVSTPSGPLWVHMVADDPVIAHAALNLATATLDRLVNDLETTAPERVDIYLYPSVADLRAALEIAGREWVNGQARPELGVILLAVPYDSRALSTLERDLPHELTHLMVYQVTGAEGYTHVPDWLDEGLATTYEMRADPDLEIALNEARAEGELIPLSELCAPFPANRERAFLSYAQAANLVQFIRDRYGTAGIRALLDAYADGASCEGGISRALNTTPERLDLAWRARLMGLSGWLAWASDNTPFLLLWGLSLLLALPMVGRLRPRERRGEQE